MKTRFLALWDALRSSLWFVPALMAAAAIGLSFATVALDEAIKHKVLENVGWLWAGGPEGARGLLSTVAGSMITVAGVVFSITIVALSLASSQFGPRLLRNFMRDTGNQVVLGTFIATFLYCLLVLRTVRGADGSEFVPYVSITVALALAVASLGVLIYFIHHASVSIQVSTVIEVVDRELDAAIDRLFPEELGREVPEQQQPEDKGEVPEGFEREVHPVAAITSGYLQAIDAGALMKVATERDLIFRVRHRPGRFVMPGGDLVLAWPGARVDQALGEQIRAAFILGSERTLTQDVEFALNQLVEVAVRALSPGMNDPFTAVSCVDRLGAALCRLATRVLPAPHRYDEDGNLRVIADVVTFAGAVDAAFTQIRQYGRTSMAVTVRLLDTIGGIAAYTRREEDRAALLRQAVMIERGGRETLSDEWDREEVEKHFQAVVRMLTQQKAVMPALVADGRHQRIS